MIRGFNNKETEKVYYQTYSKIIPTELYRVALRKLMMINAASTIDDLRIPPSNHLEKLSGDRIGQYSIRINNKYRICFRFRDGDCYDVEIVDYH